MKKFLSLLKFSLGWPLAIAALFFIGRLLFAKQGTLLTIHHLDWWFLTLSLASYVVFFFLRALFWQKLLQKKGMNFSFKQTALTWGMSELKRYVPGTIWPILSRSSAYREMGSETKQILASMLQEVEFLVAASLILSLATINFLMYGLLPKVPHIIVPLILAGLLIGVIVLLFFPTKIVRFSFLKHFPPQLAFYETAILLLTMTGTFFIYGLATYFAIASLTPLYLPHIIPLIGFFVLAFLTGYLSFIAPMGLGVREAVVTVGLVKYMPISVAALGAIFSRILQIIGELIFLVICIIWEKIKSVRLQKIERYVIQHKYGITLALFVIAYIAYFTLASFLRYNNFFTGRFDLGNMDQTVWNTIHGRLFQTTDPNGTFIISRLAYHADFMLILLSPFYLIWQDPRTLLFLQSFALGIGAIGVYFVAKEILKNKFISLSFAIAYLVYPAINYANLYDFHTVTIAVPIFFAIWYTLLKKNYFLTTLLLLLVGTAKEEIWAIVGLFGILFLWKKQYIYGIATIIAGFGLFYYLFWHAIPSVHGAQHFALSYFSEFGKTPTQVITNIILSPLKTLSLIFGKGQLMYLLQLFGPVAFLPLAGLPLLIFAAPDLAISLLSKDPQLHTIYYHYGAVPTPFIFIASIYGIFALQKYIKDSYKKYLPLVVLIPALVCAYFFGPLPGAYRMNASMFVDQLSYAPLIDTFLSSIPKSYSVAATNNIGSHLSHRKLIYTIPVGLKDADIVVFLLNDPYAQPSLSAQKKMAAELDKDPLYQKLISYNDFVVYKKKSVPTYYPRKQRGILPLFKN